MERHPADAEDPALRAEAGTEPSTEGVSTPDGAFETFRASVPDVSQARNRHGTNEPGSDSGPPLIGDEGYLEHLFAAFENGHVTEEEWHQGDRAHRFVVARKSP